MILYITAVGFSGYDEKEKTEELVSKIISNPTTKYISNYNTDEIRVEYYKEYGDDFGLVVRGTLNENEELTVYSLIPYMTGSILTDTDEIDVVKAETKDTFNAYCEESKSGTPISFFLQNVIDYMEIKDDEGIYIHGVKLVAFSVEGTVILPIEKGDEIVAFEKLEEEYRLELMEKAKHGDESAAIELEAEAEEASEELKERLKDEDILSILEGFFVPVDDHEDVYSVLGRIEEVKHLKNTETGEKLFLLKIKCMSVHIDIMINEESLIGEPSVGMRFKGTCWMQGLIEFNMTQ